MKGSNSVIEIRKGLENEEEKILSVANMAFQPYRHEGFNFKGLIPKIYDSGLPYASMHHVLIDDGCMSAVAGNIIRDFNINGKKYKYSLVGTVATLPGSEGKGYMKELMKSIDKENKDSGIVFSALMGDRKRYNYYGYEIGPQVLSYSFDRHFLKYAKRNSDLEFKEYSESENKAYYELYRDYLPVNLRKEEEFKLSLLNKYNEVIGIYRNSELIGYYSISDSSTIEELALKDLNVLEGVIVEVITRGRLNSLEVAINPLSYDLRDALDRICIKANLSNSLNIKVYRLKEFLEYIINLNLKNRTIDNLNLCYKVDSDIVEISIFKNKLSVEYVDKPYLKSFTMMEFIRYIFNLINTDSELFPLYYNILPADLF